MVGWERWLSGSEHRLLSGGPRFVVCLVLSHLPPGLPSFALMDSELFLSHCLHDTMFSQLTTVSAELVLGLRADLLLSGHC